MVAMGRQSALTCDWGKPSPRPSNASLRLRPSFPSTIVPSTCLSLIPNYTSLGHDVHRLSGLLGYHHYPIANFYSLASADGVMLASLPP